VPRLYEPRRVFKFFGEWCPWNITNELCSPRFKGWPVPGGYDAMPNAAQFIRKLDNPETVVRMIRVKVLGRKIEKELEWKNGMKIADVLREVGFNTESAIAKLNGRIALEDENVNDGDYVEVIPVVSGG